MRIVPLSLVAAVAALPIAFAPASAAPTHAPSAIEARVAGSASIDQQSNLHGRDRTDDRYERRDNRRSRSARANRAPQRVYVQPVTYRSYRQRPVYYAAPRYVSYQPRRMYRNDYAWRGNDGRYYCRRNDGTTGLIIGAAVGGMVAVAWMTGGIVRSARSSAWARVPCWVAHSTGATCVVTKTLSSESNFEGRSISCGGPFSILDGSISRRYSGQVRAKAMVSIKAALLPVRPMAMAMGSAARTSPSPSQRSF